MRMTSGDDATASQDAAGAMPDGKRRLIDAAVVLASSGRTISSLGLRELAREAGLNPNTFYRHFEDIDDLGRQICADVTRRVMDDIREARSSGVGAKDANRAVVDCYLDSVVAEPNAYRIGLNELYGPSPAMRAVMRRTMQDITDESVVQMREVGFASALPDDTLRRATHAITIAMFTAAGDLVEHPEERDAVGDRLVELITWLLVGAVTVTRPGGT